MRRRLAIPAAGIGALLLAFVTVTGRAPAEDAAPAPTVRIGLLNTLFRDAPEPLIQVLAKPFKTLMEDQAGFVGQVVVETSPDLLALQLKDNKIQLGVFHGFEFAWARLKNPELKPLMIAVNQQPFARAVLVVRQDNKAENADALQGRVLALPRLAREHCRLYVARRCVGRGLPMDKWFAKISTPGTSQDALADLADDYVHAAVVEDVELADFRKAYPKLAAKLRVLAESETFPCAVIAYQPGGMDEDVLKRLLTGMISAKTTPRGRSLMELCRITGFEAVPADYEKNLIDIRKAYPPPAK